MTCREALDISDFVLSPHAKRLLASRTCAAVPRVLVAFLVGALTISEANGADAPKQFTVVAGAGIARDADYEGSAASRLQVFPVASATFRSDYGEFIIGGDNSSPSNTTSLLSWAVGTDRFNGGLTIDYDGGRRDDRNGTFLRSGSAHLRGMGELRGTAEYGLFLSKRVDIVTVNLSARAAPRDSGHGGALADLSADISLIENAFVSTTITPTVTWMSGRYAQSYFGVSAEQAARTQFPVYAASGGTKSFGLAIASTFQLANRWQASATLSVSQLAGSAAHSPIVERRSFISPGVGLAYAW